MNDMQWDMAAKYLAGEASGEERRRFEQWLADDPDRSAALETLRPYFAARTKPHLPVDVDAAWTAMAARIDRENVVVASARPATSRRPDTRWLQWGLAAAAVLLVAVSATRLLVRDQPASGRIVVVTGPGEKRDIALADGSRILIAPMSRLEMVGHRSALLLGEAYFVVTHDARRPFRVHTRNAIVEDLGTSFVVRTGSAQQTTFVAVDEGVVSLAPAVARASPETLLLREGESGTVSSTGVVRGDSASWSRAMAWTRGEIVFDEMRLGDVASELNRWFGITVLLADPSLQSRTLSARLSGESVDEVLEAIGRSLGIRHTRTGNTVVFRP